LHVVVVPVQDARQGWVTGDHVVLRAADARIRGVEDVRSRVCGEVLEEQLPRARRRVLDAGLVPGAAGLPSGEEPGREEARRGSSPGRPVDLGHVSPHEDAVVAPGALLQVLTYRLVLRLFVGGGD